MININASTLKNDTKDDASLSRYIDALSDRDKTWQGRNTACLDERREKFDKIIKIFNDKAQQIQERYRSQFILSCTLKHAALQSAVHRRYINDLLLSALLMKATSRDSLLPAMHPKTKNITSSKKQRSSAHIQPDPFKRPKGRAPRAPKRSSGLHIQSNLSKYSSECAPQSPTGQYKQESAGYSLPPTRSIYMNHNPASQSFSEETYIEKSLVQGHFSKTQIFSIKEYYSASPKIRAALFQCITPDNIQNIQAQGFTTTELTTIILASNHENPDRVDVIHHATPSLATLLASMGTPDVTQARPKTTMVARLAAANISISSLIEKESGSYLYNIIKYLCAFTGKPTHSDDTVLDIIQKHLGITLGAFIANASGDCLEDILALLHYFCVASSRLTDHTTRERATPWNTIYQPVLKHLSDATIELALFTQAPDAHHLRNSLKALYQSMLTQEFIHERLPIMSPFEYLQYLDAPLQAIIKRSCMTDPHILKNLYDFFYTHQKKSSGIMAHCASIFKGVLSSTEHSKNYLKTFERYVENLKPLDTPSQDIIKELCTADPNFLKALYNFCADTTQHSASIFQKVLGNSHSQDSFDVRLEGHTIAAQAGPSRMFQSSPTSAPAKPSPLAYLP